MNQEIQYHLRRMIFDCDRHSVWNVGYFAELEILKAQDYIGFYLVSVPKPEIVSGFYFEETELFGLPVRFDRSLPPDRIELRDRDGRLLGAIENVGTVHDTTT